MKRFVTAQIEESVTETSPEQTWQEKSKQLAEEDEQFRRFWYVDPDDPESRGGKIGRMVGPEHTHSEMACAFYYVWRIAGASSNAYPRFGLKGMLEAYNEGLEHCGAEAIQRAWDEYNSEGDGPAGWASVYVPTRGKMPYKPAVVYEQDIIDFYAAAQSIGYLEYAPSSAMKKLIDATENLARKFLSERVWEGIATHIVMGGFVNLEKLKVWAAKYSDPDQVIDNIRQGKADWDDLAEYIEIYGGPWVTTAKEIAKLADMFPIHPGNLQEAMLQMDRVVDLEHNSGLILGAWLEMQDDEGEDIWDEDARELLDEKSRSWDMDFYKKHSPALWHIADQLKRYRRQAKLKGLTKYSQNITQVPYDVLEGVSEIVDKYYPKAAEWYNRGDWKQAWRELWRINQEVTGTYRQSPEHPNLPSRWRWDDIFEIRPDIKDLYDAVTSYDKLNDPYTKSDVLWEHSEEFRSLLRDAVEANDVDRWPSIIRDYQQDLAKVGIDWNQFKQVYRYHDAGDVAGAIEDHLPREADQYSISLNDLGEFFAITAIVGVLDEAPPSIVRYVQNVVEHLAEAMIRATFNGAMYHFASLFAENPEGSIALQKEVGNLDKFFEEMGQKLSMKSVAALGEASQGQAPWIASAKALAKVQEYLPVHKGNLTEAILALDHAMDIEHNSGLILGDYLTVKATPEQIKEFAPEEYNEQADRQVSTIYSRHLKRFLDQKENEWGLEDIKKWAPRVYNIYQHLKRYQRQAKLKGFTKYSYHNWGGGSGTGLYGPHSSEGLGLGPPWGGGSGLGHSTRLPPGHQGHSGISSGPWSGDMITDETRKEDSPEMFKKKIGDFGPEELMTKIRALMKIDTPESRNQVVFLKQILDDKMRRMKAARRAYDVHVKVKQASTLMELKDDSFTKALFAEHGIPLEKLDAVQLPSEITHFSLHKLVDELEKEAQQAQPIKGKCPESGEWVYMSQADMVEHNYKADCPEGKVKTDKLEDKKSISILEYKEKKDKKKTTTEKCGTCSMRIPTKDGLLCTAVKGKISPEGWCKWWEAGSASKKSDIQEDQATKEEADYQSHPKKSGLKGFTKRAVEEWEQDPDYWKSEEEKEEKDLEFRLTDKAKQFLEGIRSQPKPKSQDQMGYIDNQGQKRIHINDWFDFLDDMILNTGQDYYEAKGRVDPEWIARKMLQDIDKLYDEFVVEEMAHIKTQVPNDELDTNLYQWDLIEEQLTYPTAKQHRIDLGKQYLQSVIGEDRSPGPEDLGQMFDFGKIKGLTKQAQIPPEIQGQMKNLAQAVYSGDLQTAHQIYRQLPKEVQPTALKHLRQRYDNATINTIVTGRRPVTQEQIQEATPEQVAEELQRRKTQVGTNAFATEFAERLGARAIPFEENGKTHYRVRRMEQGQVIYDIVFYFLKQADMRVVQLVQYKVNPLVRKLHEAPDHPSVRPTAKQQQMRQLFPSPMEVLTNMSREYGYASVQTPQMLEYMGSIKGFVKTAQEGELGMIPDPYLKEPFALDLGGFDENIHNKLAQLKNEYEDALHMYESQIRMQRQIEKHDPDNTALLEDRIKRVEQAKQKALNHGQRLNNFVQRLKEERTQEIQEQAKMVGKHPGWKDPELHKYQSLVTKQAQNLEEPIEIETKLTFNPEEQKIINLVKGAAMKLGIPTYLVGGAVRDRLLGKRNVDLDFMCEQDAEKLTEYMASKHSDERPVEYDRSKALAVTVMNTPLDFINAERVLRPLEPEDDEEEGVESLEGEEEFTMSFDDAYRRDLTINSLMYDIVNDELIDATGRGLEDLKNKEVNTIIDPFIKYKVHAMDMLRAIRFAATLGFDLGPDMVEAMRENAERLRPRDMGGDISNRRIRRELRKAIDNPEHWAKMRELLQQAGLDVILAEDIDDVQDDFIGGIDYHFDEETKAMRIKRFITKKADDLSDRLDQLLEEQGLEPKKSKPTQQRKKPGLWERVKQRLVEPKGPVKPETGKGRLEYLRNKLDAQLAQTPRAQQHLVVQKFLNEYRQLTPDEKTWITTTLKNFRPTAEYRGTGKDVWQG